MKKILIVVSLFCVVLLIAIARRDFWYPDEPDMAEITSHMLRSGDWLRLQLYNKLFADYPPLFFWLAAALGSIAGLSEMVLRLPTAASAAALVLLTALWTKKRFGRESAFWTALVMATMSQFVWQAVNMHVDMLFALLMAASIFAYDMIRDCGKPSRRIMLLCASGLLMGLAALTKGPAGIALPCGILAFGHIINREYSLLKRLTLAGAASILVFGTWAYVYAAQAGGSNLFYFIYEQNITRFLTGHSHLRPWYSHIVNIWPDLLPWSLFLPFALVHAWKNRSDRSNLLVLLWFAVTFTFFTISRSKRQVYLLPLYPAAAAIIGCFVSNLVSGLAERRTRIFRVAVLPVGVLLATLGLVIPFLLPMLQREFAGSQGLVAPLAVLSVIAVAGGVSIVVWLRRGQSNKAIYALPVTAAGICVVAFGWLLPCLDGSLSAKDDAVWLASEQIEEEGEVLGCLRPIQRLHKESSSLSFYGNFRVEVYSEDHEIEEYMKRQPGDIFLIRREDIAWLESRMSYTIDIVKKIRIGGDRFYAVMLSPASASKT